MNKAIFKYKKDGGTITDRVVLRPQMMKESTNYLNDFNNPNVKYLHGLEIEKSGMTSVEIEKYERLIEEYYQIQMPTLENFLIINGLDPKKVQQKSFVKDKISDLQIL